MFRTWMTWLRASGGVGTGIQRHVIGKKVEHKVMMSMKWCGVDSLVWRWKRKVREMLVRVNSGMCLNRSMIR